MNKTQTKFNTRTLVFMGLICALAYICMFVFRIKVSFLTFDLKNTILAIGALIFGPVSGIVTSLVVSLLEMITVSDTGFWGCLMNFVSSALYVFIAAIIYKYNRTITGAVIALSTASIAMTGAMIVMNLLITPIYTGMPVSAVAQMIVPLLLPFNLIKAILNSAITLLIYKPVRVLFKGSGIRVSDESHTASKKTAAIMSIVAVLVIVLCVFTFVYFFNGSFELYKS